MRALKLLVVVMGVLLVAGAVALVVAVANRINHPPAVTTAGASSEIDLPSGSRLTTFEVSGDRLVVRIALADGGEQLLVFNLTTGARLATITLRQKAAAP